MALQQLNLSCQAAIEYRVEPFAPRSAPPLAGVGPVARGDELHGRIDGIGNLYVKVV
jgi:hypothetical protein